MNELRPNHVHQHNKCDISVASTTMMAPNDVISYATFKLPSNSLCLYHGIRLVFKRQPDRSGCTHRSHESIGKLVLQGLNPNHLGHIVRGDATFHHHMKLPSWQTVHHTSPLKEMVHQATCHVSCRKRSERIWLRLKSPLFHRTCPLARHYNQFTRACVRSNSPFPTVCHPP